MSNFFLRILPTLGIGKVINIFNFDSPLIPLFVLFLFNQKDSNKVTSEQIPTKIELDEESAICSDDMNHPDIEFTFWYAEKYSFFNSLFLFPLILLILM